MSHVKAGGTAKNVHDSPGQRLGIKIWGGQNVKTGQVIVRQVGMSKRPGRGTTMSRNFTIHAKKMVLLATTQRKFDVLPVKVSTELKLL